MLEQQSSPMYASAYGMYLLLIFITLFVVFLVLYLIEHNKVNSSSTPTSATNQMIEPITEEKTQQLEQSRKSKGFVTVEMMGGLGNQLFQIATAYSYAKKHDKIFILDHRQKNLGNRKTYFDTLYKWVQDSQDIKRKNWHKISEPHFHYAPIPNHFGNIKLQGYFQSIKYFDSHVRDLVRMFKTNTLAIPDNHVTVMEMKAAQTQTVSLHIRRSDYVGNSFHPVQSMDYYVAAVSHIIDQLKSRMPIVPVVELKVPVVEVVVEEEEKEKEPSVKEITSVSGDEETEFALEEEKEEIEITEVEVEEEEEEVEEEEVAEEPEREVPIVTLVVFSDDINWCKANLPNIFPTLKIIYVDSTGLMDAQELVLMSQCNHHVIANSSFSWWGAVYNDSPSKLVVAPKLWFNDANYNWQDIYCENWSVL